MRRQIDTNRASNVHITKRYVRRNIFPKKIYIIIINI